MWSGTKSFLLFATFMTTVACVSGLADPGAGPICLGLGAFTSVLSLIFVIRCGTIGSGGTQ